MQRKKPEKINYKYREGEIMQELSTYIDSTYDQHYNLNQYQATEFIIDSGHGAGFLLGNGMKYLQRYGKKGTPEDWEKDLFKTIHYCIMAIHNHRLDNEK